MDESASTSRRSKRAGYFVTGGLGLLLSAVYLALSSAYPWGSLSEPGARVWPTVVGAMLVLASLCVLWEAWRMAPAERFELPAGPAARRVALMVLLLLAYFAALEWLGQLVASTLFCVLFMKLVSPLSWPRVIGCSITICVTLYLLFVVLLKIPLPKGIAGA